MDITPENVEAVITGHSIPQIIPFLRKMLPDDEHDALRATDHVFALAVRAEKEMGLSVVCEFSRPHFDPSGKLIYIPAPMGPEYYAVALHEFGHVFGKGQEHQQVIANSHEKINKHSNPILYAEGMRAVVEAEIGAWTWAIENALIWTEDMAMRSGEAFLTYMRHELAGTQNVRPEYFQTLERIMRFRK